MICSVYTTMIGGKSDRAATAVFVLLYVTPALPLGCVSGGLRYAHRYERGNIAVLKIRYLKNEVSSYILHIQIVNCGEFMISDQSSFRLSVDFADFLKHSLCGTEALPGDIDDIPGGDHHSVWNFPQCH